MAVENAKHDALITDTWPWYVGTVLPHLETADSFLDAWHDRYMSRWLAIRRMCLRDYEKQGESWRELGAKWTYPVVQSAHREMARGHAALLNALPDLDASYQVLTGGHSRIRYVILVDIGFAGWATSYRGRRAVLLGLAQIARLGWHRAACLRDLVGHELGHHSHQLWRHGKRGLKPVEGPFGQLYEEGFAQRLSRALGNRRWHQASGNWRGWLARCRRQLPRLARKFLATVRTHGDIRPFFGDWFELDGLSMTGYFMGHELIAGLERRGMSLRNIAQLPSQVVVEEAERYLRSVSEKD